LRENSFLAWNDALRDGICGLAARTLIVGRIDFAATSVPQSAAAPMGQITRFDIPSSRN